MNINGRYDRIESVTIRPKVKSPYPFEIETETGYEEVFGDYAAPLYHVPTSRTARIVDINLSHWEVEFKTKKTPEFEAVSKIVGEDKASEVLEALGL